MAYGSSGYGRATYGGSGLAGRILPAGIDGEAAIGAPQVAVEQVLHPAGLDAGALGSSRLRYPQRVAAAGIPSSAAFGGSAVAIDQSLAPAGITSGEGFGAAVVEASAIRVSPPLDVAAAPPDAELAVSWLATEPPGTRVEVEYSPDDAASWSPVVSGAAVALPAGTTTVVLRQRLVSSVPGATPRLHSLVARMGEPLVVTGAEVRWAYRVPDSLLGRPTSEAQVRRTASVTVLGPLPGWFDLYRHRLRPWIELQAPSTGRWARFHLGVLAPLLPAVDYDGAAARRVLDCADGTARYAEAAIDRPLQVPFNRNVMLWLGEQLEDVFGEDRFALPATEVVIPDTLTFEEGSYLEMFNAVLSACGFGPLRIDEEGRPTTRAGDAARGSEHTYEPGTTMLPAGKVEPLLSAVPNVVELVPARGTGPATPVRVVNQSTGPASVDARGAEVVARVEVEAQTTADLERLAPAVARRYFAGGGLRYRGRVLVNPRHSDDDVVTLTKPVLGLSGAWDVTSWSIRLGDVEEMATMELELEARAA